MAEASIRTGGFANPYQAKNANETKVCIYIDSETTPILMKIPLPSDGITLADFKAATSLSSPNYKYFFKKNDTELGIVNEQISVDSHRLPTFKGNVVALVAKTGVLRGTVSSQTCESECNLTHSRTYDSCDESSSMMTTDLESSSYFESETEQDNLSCSNFSESTYDTSVSQIKNSHNHNSRNNCNNNAIYKPQRRQEVCTSQSSSSSSSLSDATAVQIVTVNLMLTDKNFLGLTISGRSNDVDGGIYVAEVMKNSVVDQDGRVEPGDMLLQVNDINLEDMTFEDGVAVLREAVGFRGPLKLVFAKCYEEERNLVSREEAVHPIDTAAWVAHTAALTMPDLQTRPNSTTSSPSFGSCLIDSDCVQLATAESGRPNSLNKDKTDMRVVVQHMMQPESGLEIKDREWLKILIPKAMLGSDLVFWLQHNVYGFTDRRDAKKYANQLFKRGFIRDPIAGKSFSEKCYYRFSNLTSM